MGLVTGGALHRLAVSNFPPKVNRRFRPPFSPMLYRTRNAIERMFGGLKDFRRIATRYDKLVRNVLAAVQIAAIIRYWLLSPEPGAGCCPYPLEVPSLSGSRFGGGIQHRPSLRLIPTGSVRFPAMFRPNSWRRPLQRHPATAFRAREHPQAIERSSMTADRSA